MAHGEESCFAERLSCVCRKYALYAERHYAECRGAAPARTNVEIATRPHYDHIFSNF
jgi:hypothetical protein